MAQPSLANPSMCSLNVKLPKMTNAPEFSINFQFLMPIQVG